MKFSLSLRILWTWSLSVSLLTPSRRLRSLLKLAFQSHLFIHKSHLELTLSCAIRIKIISSINLIISKPSSLRPHICIKSYSFLFFILARSTYIIYISYNKLLKIETMHKHITLSHSQYLCLSILSHLIIALHTSCCMRLLLLNINPSLHIDDWYDD